MMERNNNMEKLLKAYGQREFSPSAETEELYTAVRGRVIRRRKRRQNLRNAASGFVAVLLVTVTMNTAKLVSEVPSEAARTVSPPVSWVDLTEMNEYTTERVFDSSDQDFSDMMSVFEENDPYGSYPALNEFDDSEVDEFFKELKEWNFYEGA